ncbi:MAG TPA: ABC transporter ATP-binding protein [Polyangiaceae bacterium]|nr:ABC transporter ATP-binding protein [Polyangiaceae bacterium]
MSAAPKRAASKAGEGAKRTEAAFHEEQDLGRAYDVALLRRLWPFVRPHVRYLIASLALLVVLAATQLVRPLLMGRVVAHAGAGEGSLLLRDGLVLAAFVVGGQTVSFLQTYIMQIGGARAMADLRAAVFGFFQRLSLRYFDKTPVGRLVTRATSDVDALGELFASGVLNAIGDLFALVGIVVVMLALHARLSVVAFAALPVVALVVNYVRKRSREAFRDIRTKTARLNAFLNEQVAGVAVVQAYAREAHMQHEFDVINDAYRDANKRSIFYEAMLDATIEMVSTVCVASMLWWAGVGRTGDPTITFALVVTLTQYVRQFFEPVSLLAQRYTILQSAMSGAERIFQLLDEEDVEAETVASPEPAAGELDDSPALELDAVTFAYKPGVPVLSDVSLKVARGEKVALVGATGAGKSTVAGLFLRLYEVEEGTVRVLGRDVRAQDRVTMRERFSVVPQDVFLFTGTVLSNVAISDETPDRARVERALGQIGALELFERREGGLDARVDERGANFSAGERQLIAFARALYRDTPIVVLDEATASIDSNTEKRMQTALEVVMHGRTSLVIAHRLSTIRAVDRIIVFHKGRVVETGSHDALMAKGGVYARLHRLQFARERAAHVRLEGAPASAE